MFQNLEIVYASTPVYGACELKSQCTNRIESTRAALWLYRPSWHAHLLEISTIKNCAAFHTFPNLGTNNSHRGYNCLDVAKWSGDMRLKYGLVVVLGSIFSLSSCGDGGTDTASNNTIESVVNAETTAPFVFPTDATTLQNALTTQHASVDDFDVWLCTPQGASSPEIAYELPVAGTLGAGLVGREYVLSTGEESLFTWQVPSSTELVTTTLDTGVVSNTTNYQFGGDSSFSFAFNSTGFTCNRVDNTVAFGGAPTTSDNNNLQQVRAQNDDDFSWRLFY